MSSVYTKLNCRDSLMFWSDVTTDTIHRANLDGTGEVVLVDSCISSVGKN